MPSLSTVKIKKIKGQSLALVEDWYINNKNIFPAHFPEFEGIMSKISMNARLRFPQECVSKFLAEFFTKAQDLDQEQGKLSSAENKAIEALKLSAKKLQEELMIDEYLVLLTQVGEQLETNHNLSNEDFYQPKKKWFDCCCAQDNKLVLLHEYERLLYYYTSYYKDKKSSSLNAVKKHSQRIIQHQQKNNL